MPHPALIDQFYINIFVQCGHQGCTKTIIPEAKDIGNDVVSDPIDQWAVELADKAEADGWRVVDTDKILCPNHVCGSAEAEGNSQ